jgi:heme oxygenase
MTTQPVGIEEEGMKTEIEAEAEAEAERQTGKPTPNARLAKREASVREKLQQHTHGFHTRLSHHPRLLGLTRPGYSIQDYTTLLLVYHRFYRRIEGAIEAGLQRFDLPYRYEKRRRLPWLEADLRHFAIEPPDAERPTVSLEIDSPGKIIGTLYAIEGSALGGQVILRHLSENMGLSGATGARFFSGYGHDTPLRWQEFGAFAECFGEKPEALQEAKFAATDVFITLKTLLDSCDEPPVR